MSEGSGITSVDNIKKNQGSDELHFPSCPKAMSFFLERNVFGANNSRLHQNTSLHVIVTVHIASMS